MDTANSGKKPAQACVRIVRPFEWAKIDLFTYTFYSDVYEHPVRNSTETLSIKTTQVVQRRSPFIGLDVELWTMFEGVPCVTQTGDTVLIPFASRSAQAEDSRKVKDTWFEEKRSGGLRRAPAVFRAVV